jgi:hypothetical protein
MQRWENNVSLMFTANDSIENAIGTAHTLADQIEKLPIAKEVGLEVVLGDKYDKVEDDD